MCLRVIYRQCTVRLFRFIQAAPGYPMQEWLPVLFNHGLGLSMPRGQLLIVFKNDKTGKHGVLLVEVKNRAEDADYNKGQRKPELCHAASRFPHFPPQLIDEDLPDDMPVVGLYINLDGTQQDQQIAGLIKEGKPVFRDNTNENPHAFPCFALIGLPSLSFPHKAELESLLMRDRPQSVLEQRFSAFSL